MLGGGTKCNSRRNWRKKKYDKKTPCNNQSRKSVSCITNPVEQLSSGAVLQEKINSWSLFPMTKESHNVGMDEHLTESKCYKLYPVKLKSAKISSLPYGCRPPF